MKRMMCSVTFAKPYGFPDLPRRLPTAAAIAMNMPVTTRLVRTDSMSLFLCGDAVIGLRLSVCVDARLRDPFQLLSALDG